MPNSTIDIGLENIQQNSITRRETHAHHYNEIAFNTWNEISKKRILIHFQRSLKVERVDLFLKENTELLPNEKAILFWLAKVYGDSMNTIELYCTYLVRFLNYSKKDFYHVSYMDIDAFLRSLNAANMKANTINTISATLKSFYRTVSDAGLMNYNPTSFIKKTKKNHKTTLQGHLQHSFSAEEMKTLDPATDLWRVS